MGNITVVTKRATLAAKLCWQYLRLHKWPALLVLISVISILVIAAASHNTRTIITNEPAAIKDARTKMLEIQSLLNDINDPITSPVGLGHVQHYVSELDSYASSVPPAPMISTLPPRWPSFIPRSSTRLWQAGRQINSLYSQDIESVYNSLDRIALETEALIRYHRNVMDGVAKVLDYNPASDFTQFDINNPHTLERIQRAKSGLGAAISALEGQSEHDDPLRTGIIDQISELLIHLEELESTGDVDSWIIAVGNAQANIKQNRSEFWSSKKNRIINTINTANSILSQLESSLRLLATNR